jgi:hypothetical protein
VVLLFLFAAAVMLSPVITNNAAASISSDFGKISQITINKDASQVLRVKISYMIYKLPAKCEMKLLKGGSEQSAYSSTPTRVSSVRILHAYVRVQPGNSYVFRIKHKENGIDKSITKKIFIKSAKSYPVGKNVTLY